MTHTAWLDCDPGIDDAIALLTLLGRPDVTLAGVSTTHGNVSLTQTTRNALGLLTLAGRAEVPVYTGAAAPLVREPVYAADIHGADGLGGVTLPASSQQAKAMHGALALANALLRQDGEMTLLATGPLTNLALAERLFPNVLQRAKQVVIMGGSLEVGAPKLGNVTEWAEFNTYADPEALHVVLQSGAKPYLLGLNLTRQVVVSTERAAQLEQVGTLAARTAAAFMCHYLQFIAAKGQREGALHDPCTAAFALQPELFEVEETRVEVKLGSGEHYGQTVRVDGEPNVRLVTRANEDGVYKLIAEALGRLP